MADVRLTATNPEDSSVVPVACNEKGELKLEEIPDQSFDGNLQGDLTVSGSAEFAGRVNVDSYIQTPLFLAGGPEYPSSNASIQLRKNTGSQAFYVDENIFQFGGSQPSSPNIQLNNDGSASFASDVGFGTGLQSNGYGGYLGIGNTTNGKYGGVIVVMDTDDGNAQPCFRAKKLSSTPVEIRWDGSATFAGNKAGFTAEGHLWCTTRRGDTVILDATSNGMGIWEPYSPPTSRDKLEEWAEKNVLRPKPEESSQDGTETTQ